MCRDVSAASQLAGSLFDVLILRMIRLRGTMRCIDRTSMKNAYCLIAVHPSFAAQYITETVHVTRKLS